MRLNAIEIGKIEGRGEIVEKVAGAIELDFSAVLGRGATAQVYQATFRDQKVAAKIYNDDRSGSFKKIEAMLLNPPDEGGDAFTGNRYRRFAWPSALLEDPSRDQYVGYLMPFVDFSRAYSLDHFYDQTLFKKMQAPKEVALSFKLEIARNLCEAVADLHSHGHFFIDMKPQNIRVYKGTHEVCLLDCDGFSIDAGKKRRYPAELISTDYIAPEVFSTNANPETLGVEQDLYALAVILFQLLNRGGHPFQGIVTAPNIMVNTNDEKAAAGLYPHGVIADPRIKPRPQSTHHLWDDDTRALFDRAFAGRSPDERPSAREWAGHFSQLLEKKILVMCKQHPKVLDHIRFRGKECPACYLNALTGAPRPKPNPPGPNQPVAPTPPRPEGGFLDPSRELTFAEVMLFLLAAWVIGLCIFNFRDIEVSPEKSAPSVSSPPAASQNESAYEKGLKSARAGDFVTALREWKPLAEQGNSKAQVGLGMMYSRGDGVPRDNSEALKWFRLAAGQGDAQGQNNLGLMYDNGDGVPRDYKEAVKWYRLAAEQGDASAQYNLGVTYENGDGVPQDDKEAAKWYRLAADQGDASAQANLGVMYATGEGVPQDDKEAVKWFRLAAEQGDAHAQFLLGLTYRRGQGVPQDYKEAAKWYRLAADQGDAGAQNNLGLMYDNGQGVPQDDKESVKWYRLAAHQGHASAQANLGVMYATGEGVPQDYTEAVKWYRLAADQGDAQGQNNLGLMHDNGDGVPQDDKEAVKWYRLAAEQGYASAQYNLALMYAYGQGVPKDAPIAYMWFNIADAGGDKDATEERDKLTQRMTPSQIKRAQLLTRGCIAKNYKGC
ncbi:MAG: hypothetical protein QE509_15880 [Gammaproteobacteria bacterium]|nr:hypothetical protein [Gammaproteobacteria bacterium]